MIAAFDELERRVTQSLLRDLHEFRACLSAEIEKLSDRVKDLERHVEEKDGTIDQLSDNLRQSREEVAALQIRSSVRDQIWTRRLELRGRELFISESLTKLRSLIFRSLLATKREKRIYTVYTRGGLVFFKEKQHGVSTRVNTLQKVRESGLVVLDR
ncbi:hypothetical protein FJT64_018444 [Amphibalanus amphitrite]|uniref:Uncharacterized protein n=1 Tax=Amphibalanus amphitrite TaxID=1232801 RepID=A0A6A4X6I4_AMPAM|nr:hypothetical protein FJT64_018444 [Amphibalanus amphitrite]